MENDDEVPPEHDVPKGLVFERLMSEAQALPSEQAAAGIKAIARKSKEAGLDSADELELIEAIFDQTAVPRKIVEARFEDARRWHAEHGSLNDAGAVADGFISDAVGSDGAILHTDGSLYLYVAEADDPAFGTYRVISNADFDGHLLTGYPAAVVDSAAKRKEVGRHVELKTRIDNAFGASVHRLGVRNGTLMLDPSTGIVTLVPHAPENLLRNKVDVDHDPGATCEGFQRAVLRICNGDEQAATAVEVFLACVAFRARLPHDAVRTCMLLRGQPRTGKSTLIHLAQQFVYSGLITSVSPARMGKPENIASLAHSQLNIQTELPGTQALPTDDIKKIASGEPVEGRRMRQDPFSFRPFVFNLWGANQLPKFKDSTDGSILRRLIIIDMGAPLTDAEVEADFPALVEREKAGIVNLLASKLTEAWATGRFPLPSKQRELGAELLHGDDLVARFVRLHIECRVGHRLLKDELARSLHAFYRSHDADYPQQDSGLMRRASEAMKGAYGALRGASGGKPYYSGVALRADAPDFSAEAATAPRPTAGPDETGQAANLDDMG